MYSVLIPAYQVPDYIGPCVESLLLREDIEIIIGVDGCRETLEAAKPLGQDPRVKVFAAKTNLGTYLMKNSIAALSTKPRLLYFDGDDIALPMIYDELDKIHATGAQVGRMQYLDFEGDYTGAKPGRDAGEGVFSIERDLFLRLNGFYIKYRVGMDTEFKKRIQSRERIDIGVTPGPVFLRRLHATNLTRREDLGARSAYRGLARSWIHKKDKAAKFPDPNRFSSFVLAPV